MNRVALLGLCLLGSACSAVHPAPAAYDLDNRDPKEEFEALASLSGEWSGTGCGGTKCDLVEIRFRVLDEGQTVEALMFAGTPMESTVTYRLVDGRLLMTQQPSNGDLLRMPAEPSAVPIRVRSVGIGAMTSVDPCGETPPKIPPPTTFHEMSRTRDPSMHWIQFRPSEPTRVPWPVGGRLVDCMLTFDARSGISIGWEYAPEESVPERVQYHLTRKQPGGTERTADHDESPTVIAAPKAYFDLRSEP